MPTKTKPPPYLTPLNIPAGKSEGGGHEAAEIKVTEAPAGTPLLTGTLRTAMFRGQKAGSIKYPFPTRWHELLLDGGRMMSDWPIEQIQHDAELRGFRGNVLVGGLGLGYAVAVLARRPAVKSVTVVEINPNVVALTAAHVPDPEGKVRVVTADLLEYLKGYTGPAYDRAFYDIWASDGEGTFFETVCPLYDLSRGKVEAPPVNWNESVMRGQLVGSLQSRLLWLTLKPEEQAHLGGLPPGLRSAWEEDGTGSPWHNWSVPFFRWWKDAGEPGRDDPRTHNAVRLYAGLYGTWDWAIRWKQARFALS